MLGSKTVHPTLPAVDIKRAREFYEKKLGLKVLMEDPSPGVMFGAGAGTLIYVYQRGATKADHTVAEFEVDDIEAEMKELRGKGVKFEEYNLPEMGIKTVNGVATFKMPEGDMKAAWFRDTEGNILAMEQVSRSLKNKLKGTSAGAKA